MARLVCKVIIDNGAARVCSAADQAVKALDNQAEGAQLKDSIQAIEAAEDDLKAMRQGLRDLKAEMEQAAGGDD